MIIFFSKRKIMKNVISDDVHEFRMRKKIRPTKKMTETSHLVGCRICLPEYMTNTNLLEIEKKSHDIFDDHVDLPMAPSQA